MLAGDLRPGAYHVGGPVRQAPGQPDPGARGVYVRIIASQVTGRRIEIR